MRKVWQGEVAFIPEKVNVTSSLVHPDWFHFRVVPPLIGLPEVVQSPVLKRSLHAQDVLRAALIATH